MTTIEDKNIPSRRGQHLIQVQLIYSLQFCDYDEEKYDNDYKDTWPNF